jgi:hypothetical protein
MARRNESVHPITEVGALRENVIYQISNVIAYRCGRVVHQLVSTVFTINNLFEETNPGGRN